MNVILLGSQDCWLDDTTVLLSDRRAVHILDVLKPTIGDTLRVGVRDGALGTGRVVAIDGSTVTLAVNTPESSKAPSIRDRAGLAKAEDAAPDSAHGG